MKKSKIPKNKYIIVALLVTLLAGLAGVYFVYHGTHNKDTQVAEPSTSKNPVNLQPATKDDSKRADSTKQTNIERSQQEATPNGPTTTRQK